MSESKFEELSHNETYVAYVMQDNDGFLASFITTHDRCNGSTFELVYECLGQPSVEGNVDDYDKVTTEGERRWLANTKLKRCKEGVLIKRDFDLMDSAYREKKRRLHESTWNSTYVCDDPPMRNDETRATRETLELEVETRTIVPRMLSPSRIEAKVCDAYTITIFLEAQKELNKVVWYCTLKCDEEGHDYKIMLAWARYGELEFVKQGKMNNVVSKFDRIIGMVWNDDTMFDWFLEQIKDLAEAAAMKNPIVFNFDRKNETIKELIGVSQPDSVEILPPFGIRNKGQTPGKCFVRATEKAAKIAKKPKRLCRCCKKEARRDSHNWERDPVLAIKWIMEMKTAFDTCKCFKDNKVVYARSMLKVDAIFWWEMETGGKGSEVARRWMELLTDYDCIIKYHSGKANVVADALSRKWKYVSPLMYALRTKITSNLIEEIKKAQQEAMLLENLKNERLVGATTTLTEDYRGLRCFGDRSWVPKMRELRKQLLEQTHKSKYLVHHGTNKMYQDLLQFYWWQGMEKDVAYFMERCLTCLQVKVKHQPPYEKLQPLRS
ncbi:hypothetical protein OSB04_019889 [Centaurea solstitialis]|uniref:Integrase zinc-binding domain-containing protein n=1 Tax=Centaurea solstitialis TaxID=347529 RepID=A0AA38T2M4_9ASTR|nr:hypothetical protein OSB04_019889 [Centaurea solstitialis]